uniref:putative methyltransferase NSUN7 isoform X2 n=1 Tax=Oncorhynchus gorbuscha TaxID=8017 RepID=UPI001EAF84C8|nr:putative methyltransferase NSUN7 isoform X2 [Oncorhynchus gorbuscha]
MVKKNTGHSRRSSISKTAGGSQISSLKDLSLLDGSGLGQEETPELPPEPPTPDESHLGFPDPVYLLAAVIFQNTHLEKPAAHRLVSYGKRAGLPLPEAKDEAYQRSSYELAFNTLKYQELLEDIMIDSCFYLSQPMPDDQMSLVVVMLYDFQDRKFLPRECQGEELVQEVREVENCLLRFKTKLAASLARSRIKHDLVTIDCILPEAVRKKQERANRLLLYAWVNTFKSSLEEVCGVLKRGGFSQVNSVGQMEGQSFCQDPHCVDVLVFPPQLKADLYRTKLLSDNKLIIQDKWCSIGPCVVRSLLLPDGDVLMAGSSSGLTMSHTASLVTHGNAHGNSQSKVFVCVGDRPPAQREELQEVLANMACKNVKLIPMSFLSLDPCDLRLQRVRVILLTPQCSVSAVSNPVEFILQENGDTDLLQDLSQGSIAQTKLDTLVAQQKRDIIHALKFPKVQVVVYSTCSLYPEENEEVVRGALEQAVPTEGPKLQAFSPTWKRSSLHRKCLPGQQPRAYWTGSIPTIQPGRRGVADRPTRHQSVTPAQLIHAHTPPPAANPESWSSLTVRPRVVAPPLWWGRPMEVCRNEVKPSLLADALPSPPSPTVPPTPPLTPPLTPPPASPGRIRPASSTLQPHTTTATHLPPQTPTPLLPLSPQPPSRPWSTLAPLRDVRRCCAPWPSPCPRSCSLGTPPGQTDTEPPSAPRGPTPPCLTTSGRPHPPRCP